MKITLSQQRSVDPNLVFGLFSTDKQKVDQKSLQKNQFFLSLKESDQKFIQTILNNKTLWNDQSLELIPLSSDLKKKLIIFGLGQSKDWALKKSDLVIRKIFSVL